MKLLQRFTNKQPETTGEAPGSPYSKAQHEWSSRLGTAKSQLLNWQLLAFGSFIICFILLIALIILISKHQNYVYVAEIKPNETVVNAISLPQKLSPNMAQKAYFVSEFIHEIMTLALDPVVVRDNWLQAYQKVDGQAVAQLTTYAQNNNPLDGLGRMSKEIVINNFNAVSDNSLHFTWTETTYDEQGQVQSEVVYSGLFTLAQTDPPKNINGILANPFGLKITYFSMNSEGTS